MKYSIPVNMKTNFNSAKELMDHYEAVRNRLTAAKEPKHEVAVAIEPVAIEAAEPIVHDAILKPFEVFRRGSIGLIVFAACRYWNVSKKAIMQHSRLPEDDRKRMITMYLCSILTFKSETEISHYFGGRDRTATKYARTKISGLIAKGDKEIITDVEGIKSKIQFIMSANKPTKGNEPCLENQRA